MGRDLPGCNGRLRAVRLENRRYRLGSGEKELGPLNQAEVAAILQISRRAVGQIERRAFDKIRTHPALNSSGASGLQAK